MDAMFLDRHSFPTRRSSDLAEAASVQAEREATTSKALAARLQAALNEKKVALHEKQTALEAKETALRQLRSEEHTSELQSRGHLVCRLLLEKKHNDYVHQSI